MRALVLTASMLALILGAATVSGCGPAGMGQQSLVGASMDWRHSNSVPADMIGGIVRAGGTRRK